MSWRILAIGRSGDPLPDHDDILWSDDPRAPCDAVALFAPAVPPTDLSPLLPLAQFGGPATSVLPDFAAPQPSADQLDAMLAAFAPIRARLDECEGTIETAGHTVTDLAILRLGYSRAQTLDTMRSPVSSATLIYPLLHGRPGLEETAIRPALESLASLDLLDRRFAARVLTCPTCHGGRLSAFEACTACGSAHLMDEPILHHYRCGYQDGESRFVSGLDLICPKCKQELRHFGVDYGRPGSMTRCRACQQVMSEPQPSFHCLDCQTVSAGDQAPPVDWHHYGLTERGIAVARSGVLPQDSAAGSAAAFPRTFPLKDFTLLVREQLLVAHRYERAMTIGRIGIRNLGVLRRQQGVAAGGAIHLFSQILVESLRDTDFVTAPRDDLLLVAMPETDTAEAEVVFGRIRQAAARHLALPVELETEAVPAAQSGLLLDEIAS